MARSKRNDFLVGVFILAALALLAAVMIVITDWDRLQRETRFYHVEFPQAPGIRAGSEVQLGGVPVGRVVRLLPPCWSVDPQTERATFSYVAEIEVPREVKLRRGADVRILGKLIGEGAVINIQDAGSGEPVKTKPDNPIQGTSGSAMETAALALGIGEDEKQNIRQIIADLKETSSKLRKAAPAITRVMERADQITEQLEGKMPAILESVDSGARNISQASEKIDGILEENRDGLKETIADLKAVASKAEQRVPQILDDLHTTAHDVRTLIAANRMNVTASLENVRQTTERMKSAVSELLQDPWRLFHKPGAREADTINILGASRRYADAVSDLRSMAATFKTLEALEDEEAPGDQKLMRDMLDRVRVSLEQYQKAEEAFWKAWGQAGN